MISFSNGLIYFVQPFPPSPKSLRAADIVIVNPAITSTKDITVKNKNVESPLGPTAQGEIIHDIKKAINTNVDKVWSTIDTLEVRVALKISILRVIRPSKITRSPHVGRQIEPEGSHT